MNRKGKECHLPGQYLRYLLLKKDSNESEGTCASVCEYRLKTIFKLSKSPLAYPGMLYFDVFLLLILNAKGSVGLKLLAMYNLKLLSRVHRRWLLQAGVTNVNADIDVTAISASTVISWVIILTMQAKPKGDCMWCRAPIIPFHCLRFPTKGNPLYSKVFTASGYWERTHKLQPCLNYRCLLCFEVSCPVVQEISNRWHRCRPVDIR